MANKNINGFAKILIDTDVISLEQYNEAEQVSRETATSVSDSLIKLGYATGEEVMQAPGVGK